MANTNTAGFGLQPVMRVGNTPAIQGQSKYEIDAAETNAIYNGEPVKIDISATTGGYIVTAAAGTACVGVLNGVFYNAATTLKPTWSNYYPAATTPANRPTRARDTRRTTPRSRTLRPPTRPRSV